LKNVAAQEPEATHVLLVNSDHQLAFVLAHREQLEQHYVVPYADAEAVARLADKTAMYRVLAELGIPAPATVSVDPGAGEQAWRAAAEGLTFPIVMKPFAGAEFEELDFAGHRKVYRLADAQELVTELGRIAATGYTGTMLLQQLILGDDTYNRVVNVYRDRRGQLTMAASGQVLLAMHQPTFIGNSAIIMVDYDEQLIEPVRAVLDAVDYRGFASVDFKVDSRDGVAYLLDINPRPGRSHYYAGVGAPRLRAAWSPTSSPTPSCPPSGRLCRGCMPTSPPSCSVGTCATGRCCGGCGQCCGAGGRCTRWPMPPTAT